MCRLLEQERQEHNQLKHTWQRANDQFLESQRLLMRDMQRMEVVLTSEQLRRVEALRRRDQVSGTPAPHPTTAESEQLRRAEGRGSAALEMAASGAQSPRRHHRLRNGAHFREEPSVRLCPGLPGLPD